MTITQERIDAIKEDCNQAIAYGRAKKGMDAHATLPANDVLAIIEEVEKLLKQTGRAKVLLGASFDLLEKCGQAPVVLEVLCETAFYDDTECDGYCLKEDISHFFEEFSKHPTGGQ